MARLSTRYGGAMLSGLRFLIASPFVLVLMVATGGLGDLQRSTPGAVAAIVVSAGVGYGIGDTVYVRALPRVGLQRLAPTATALWVGLSAIGGVLLFEEQASWWLALGGAGVVLGTYLVVAARSRGISIESGAGHLGTPATVGVVVMVASAWAAATLLLAAGQGQMNALSIAAVRIPAGGLTIAFVLLASSRGEVLRRLPSRPDLPLVLALGVLGTAVGSLLYIYGITEAGVARSTILNSTSPLIVVPLSMYFLGERPTALTAIGTAVCLAGTLLVVALG